MAMILDKGVSLGTYRTFKKSKFSKIRLFSMIAASIDLKGYTIHTILNYLPWQQCCKKLSNEKFIDIHQLQIYNTY